MKTGFGVFGSHSGVEKASFLSLLISACADQPAGSSSVNEPYPASLAVMGHQQDVLQIARIWVLSKKNNNVGGLDLHGTGCSHLYWMSSAANDSWVQKLTDLQRD